MSQKAEKNRLYKVLEIEASATETEIKKAYRKLAMVSFFSLYSRGLRPLVSCNPETSRGLFTRILMWYMF